MPSVLVRAPRPPRWNASKMRACSASAIPTPVSRTSTSRARRRRARDDVDRAACVGELDRVGEQVEHDLLELELVGRARGRDRRSHLERRARRRWRAGALADHREPVLEQRARSETGASSSSIRPASTLERSRISLISSSRCRPESRMSRRYSSWRSLSSPNIRSSSTSENPMTALSGVRSSCDMLARNSDLCRLATSSWRLRSCSSRNTRALWMATADWLASVSSSSAVRSEKAPVRLAPDDQRADDLLLPHAAEPRAASAIRRRRAPRGVDRAARSARSGLAAAAAPTPRARRTSRRCGCASARARRPATDRSRRRSEARTARSTRRTRRSSRPRCPTAAPPWPRSSSSTSSRSRLEDTAWLISPSARSSSAERVSSLEQLDVLDRDRRLRGERRQEARSSGRRTDRPRAARASAPRRLGRPPASARRASCGNPRARDRSATGRRVGEHVGDMDDAPFQADAADERLGTVRHRMLPHVTRGTPACFR